MGDRRRAICKGCDRHRRNVGELSWTGLCSDCAETRRRSNFDAMVARSGPEWTHWRRAMAATVGGVLLDDVLPKP